MNPLLPMHHRVPDTEARVFDNKLYFYGSYDKDYDTYYCSKELRIFSTVDMKTITEYGISMQSDWIPRPDCQIYAPDCVKYNDLYYLFWASSDSCQWVAQSEKPYGPFRNIIEIKLPVKQIDPAVLIDDNDVYYYWGQFNCHCVKMMPDMHNIDMSTYKFSILNENDHGFHEGISIRKINDIYYLIFTDISRGRATCLSYATASTPIGPFIKRGVIIDNTKCDPESWNNHGSIVEFNNQWYICYHRSSLCREGMRRLCMEKINIKIDGSIDEVEMTTQGIDEPLDPDRVLPAAYACELRGKVRIDISEQYLSRFENLSFAVYKYFAFSGSHKFYIKCASLFDDCRLKIRVDAYDGEILGEVTIPCTGGWMDGGINGFTELIINHRPLYGIHAIYLEAICDENKFFNLKEFYFTKNIILH